VQQMSRRLELAPIAPRGCAVCAFRPTCGGLEQQSFYGCFATCGPCGVDQGKCDYSCPRKPGFWRDWAEVGGLDPQPRRELPGPSLQLPQYIPMVRHGSSRVRPLASEAVALNTFEVIDSRSQCRDRSAEELRQRFMIASDATVLLISVNHDRHVESFWEHRSQAKLEELGRLGIAAVSTPNFSLFDDAPRIHSVRNLWRILRTAEDLADAGVMPILHVNAICREDWRWWAKVLRRNPAVRYVSKEFQTGLTDPERAADALDGLRRLQDELGHDLHPIIVGGRRVIREIGKSFVHFSLTDSFPFMATVKRRRIVVDGDSVKQIESFTKSDETLDRLLRSNLRSYREAVHLRSRLDGMSISDEFDDV
jgi:hypothetical protein